jgi:hypothetical protein
MNPTSPMKQAVQRDRLNWWLFLAALALTTAVYWAGLSGTYIFDDYPNIIDNHGVQPTHASLPALFSAALSSPSSEFKRPLSSLSFAVNYLATGLDPYWMKLTNLVIHLLNGLLVFLLAGALLRSVPTGARLNGESSYAKYAPAGLDDRSGTVAALIAAGWMLLPINLTAVLYVVQRMESLANLFVLLGLIGYVAGRRRMLASTLASTPINSAYGWSGFWLCAASVTLPTAIGLLAKETAVMLPLYAVLIEWLLFGFRSVTQAQPASVDIKTDRMTCTWDSRLIGLFLLVLALPLSIGLIWILPGLMQPEHWSNLDYTLGMRLLSEARIVVDYIVWTILPTPNALSFYHDNFNTSTGLLTPWTTFACLIILAGLIALTWWLRSRRPLVALGIAMFLGCQMLTATVLPLELIYEHRNYFASFGLLLAIVPLLAAYAPAYASTPLAFALPRRVLLAGLLMLWTAQTVMTALAWGSPLHLAEELAGRAPDSPRAQYELGRTYIIYSNYDPASPFTKLAYKPLEIATSLPNSSILPEQALIFMNSRMHLPLKDTWWDSMITRLKTHKPTVQDESALAALTQCAREHHCDLPQDRMVDAFMAALTHPDPSARLLANYGDYAWNVLDDKSLGQHMAELAVLKDPDEPVYRITLIRILLVQSQLNKAREALRQLQSLNFGGRLNAQIAELRALPGM